MHKMTQIIVISAQSDELNLKMENFMRIFSSGAGELIQGGSREKYCIVLYIFRQNQ